MEKCKYKIIDEEHNIYQCEACGYIVELEADGPFENGLDYCAHCGREVVHPFQCDCGYIGDPETIAFERQVAPGAIERIKEEEAQNQYSFFSDGLRPAEDPETEQEDSRDADITDKTPMV